jgi:hypothetical protein
MTDSRQYPLVVMTAAEAATLARFGMDARFEAGTRTMFGHECKIVTDHHLGRFAMFVDETDTERIAEALNGGVTSVYVWRDDLAGAVVGTEWPAVGSPAPVQGRVRVIGHPDAVAGVQGHTALIREAREKHVKPGAKDAYCDYCSLNWPCLTIRLVDALEVSVARTAELEAVIRNVRNSGMNEYDPIPHWAAQDLRKAVSL